MFPTRLPLPALFAFCLAPLLLAACDRDGPPAAEPALAPPTATATARPDAARTDVARAEAAPAKAMQAIETSMARFRGARSFVAEMTLQSAQAQRSRLEYVAPDRYRLQLPGGSQVIVGDTLYLQGAQGIERVPLPPGLLAQWRDPLQLRPGERLQVEDLGPDTLDGQAAHKYRVRHPDASRPPMLYWIDARGWPSRIEQAGRDARGDYVLAVAYSRFDDPALRVDPP
ncbi:MAG TPA: hypothetical protein VGC74_13910 [Stenotrophomonas sp.]|jgi:hypothetical protein